MQSAFAFLYIFYIYIFLQLLAEEEKTTKLNRDLQFERKMHEELKSKHKHLKTVEEDLNEEYVNLKLNYQHLKESMEGQVSDIRYNRLVLDIKGKICHIRMER